MGAWGGAGAGAYAPREAPASRGSRRHRVARWTLRSCHAAKKRRGGGGSGREESVDVGDGGGDGVAGMSVGVAG